MMQALPRASTSSKNATSKELPEEIRYD